MGLTHLSLFSGIGGLDIAAEMAGFETVGQCEWADYPTKILEKHWPDVPRWRDIRTLTGVSFYERTGLRTVDIISGGFPCQPFSVAGERRGKEDDRYLWPEMLRVIQEIRPTWVLGENVPGIINLALDEVLSSLENIGYSCEAFLVPACGVDAPHKRFRIAILAHRNDRHRDSTKETLCTGRDAAIDNAGDVSDTDNRRGAVWRHRQFPTTPKVDGDGKNQRGRTEAAITGERRQSEPGMVGVVDGICESVYRPITDTESDRLPYGSIFQMGGGQSITTD